MITKGISTLPPGVAGLKVGSLKANSEASKGTPRPVPQPGDIPQRPLKYEAEKAAPSVSGAKQPKPKQPKGGKAKPQEDAYIHRISSRLDQATLDMIMKRANDEDRTPSTIIRKALEAWAESERRKEKRGAGTVSTAEN